MAETKSSKYRFGHETLDQIEWLKQVYCLESHADVLRYAVSRLYTERKKSIEKYLKKSEKSA